MGRRIPRALAPVCSIVVLVSLLLAWPVWRCYVFWQEERVIAELEAKGAAVESGQQEPVPVVLGVPIFDRKTIVTFNGVKADLALAARVRKLVRLDLFDTTVTADAASALSKMTDLEALWMERVRASDQVWVHLGQLKRLEGIFLIETPVTEDGLRHLVGLPELKYVSLRSCNVTDDCVDTLLDFPSLWSLHLTGNPISDEGLDKLCDYRGELGHLDLSHTRITDAGLPALERMNGPAILMLYGTMVSDEAVAKLQAAKPSLQIQK